MLSGPGITGVCLKLASVYCSRIIIRKKNSQYIVPRLWYNVLFKEATWLNLK